MKIASSWSTSLNTATAINEAYTTLVERLGCTPDLILVYSSITYDGETVLTHLRHRSPNTQILGGTSCIGVMTEEGFHEENSNAIALWGISDPNGSYGVGAVEMNGDPRSAASTALKQALRQAGRSGELPRHILLASAPGHEEELLLGIKDVIGPDVPVTGGSTADNSIEGKWKQFSNDRVYTDAVVIAAMFPSVEVAYAFHNGYKPTEFCGRITKSNGRNIYEIDHRPAAEVYNEWTGGIIEELLPSGGNILSLTTLHPLGMVVGGVSGIPCYRLAHPETVTSDGGLTLFADMQEGTEIVLMTGTRDSLITRAGRVAQAAMDSKSLSTADISGALLIYCAGCMLTVKDDINQVVVGMRQALGDNPFLGTFTFGEQGCFLGGENHHGNLMISVLVFGK